MSTVDYVSQHGEALERAIITAVKNAIVARATDPLAYVARELSVAAGPTELREELETLRAQLATVTAERDAALGALPVVATAPAANPVPALEGFTLTGVSLLSPLHPECPAGRCGVSHAVRQSAASAEADGIRSCLQRGKPHCWEPVCARATGEAAIRINHYGHAPLTEQNHTYIGAGEKLVDDHWAPSLAQSLSENR